MRAEAVERRRQPLATPPALGHSSGSQAPMKMLRHSAWLIPVVFLFATIACNDSSGTGDGAASSGGSGTNTGGSAGTDAGGAGGSMSVFPPTVTLPRIMIVGDSISAGPGCYKKYLVQNLTANGITNYEFVGEY